MIFIGVYSKTAMKTANTDTTYETEQKWLLLFITFRLEINRIAGRAMVSTSDFTVNVDNR